MSTVAMRTPEVRRLRRLIFAGFAGYAAPIGTWLIMFGVGVDMPIADSALLALELSLFFGTAIFACASFFPGVAPWFGLAEPIGGDEREKGISRSARAISQGVLYVALLVETVVAFLFDVRVTHGWLINTMLAGMAAYLVSWILLSRTR